MMTPKKWTEVYPYGTKEGDEEAEFFNVLSRHHKYTYRSVSQIVKETGLSRERIEHIIEKYSKMKPPLIFSHPTTEDNWGYWERNKDRLSDVYKSISQKDKDNRIDQHLKN